MSDINEESRKLHIETRGKLEVRSKVPLQNRHDLSLSYTPGVAAISSDISKNVELVRKYTMKGNSVAVVTDGSSVLGLGNLGAEAALPVMEGKAILFKEFANIDAFPICLATQDSEEIIKTVKYISPVFGGINLEDIAAPRCFEIEARLRRELDIPVMHDDQHGTAVVVLAALINALSLLGSSRELSADQKLNTRIVISGAGAAGTAITKLLIRYGFENIVVSDSKGAIFKGRNDLNDEKIELAKITNPTGIQGSLGECLRGADVFIGVSRGGLVSKEMVAAMNKTNGMGPIIFALANPIPEIMPDEAYAAGAFAVSTGRSDFPNQVNNCLAFPGIFRGALDFGIKQFEDQMFVRAALALSGYVKNPTREKLLPDIFDKEVVKVVSGAIGGV